MSKRDGYCCKQILQFKVPGEKVKQAGQVS